MSNWKPTENSLVVTPGDKPQQNKQDNFPNLNKGNFGDQGQGRPTKYDVKYADDLIKFFQQDRYMRYIKAEKIVTKKDGTQEKFYTYDYMPNDLPTLDKFARSIGVNGDTLVEWASSRYPKDHEDKEKAGQLKRPKFSAAYQEAKLLQKEFLVDNGLRGMYNPTAFVFVASNFTDMRQKENPKDPGDEKTLPEPIYGSRSKNI